jgi:hypothetical protein
VLLLVLQFLVHQCSQVLQGGPQHSQPLLLTTTTTP